MPSSNVFTRRAEVVAVQQNLHGAAFQAVLQLGREADLAIDRERYRVKQARMELARRRASDYLSVRRSEVEGPCAAD